MAQAIIVVVASIEIFPCREVLCQLNKKKIKFKIKIIQTKVRQNHDKSRSRQHPSSFTCKRKLKRKNFLKLKKYSLN